MLGRILKQISFGHIEVLESWVGKLAISEHSIYAGLRNANHIFRDDLFADCYSPIGRESKSPSMLMKVIILQFVDNVSDREAEQRAAWDVRWKYALGGEIGKAGFDYSLLSKFRARLMINKKERTIFDEILGKAIDEGFIRNKCAKQIIDSTSIFGAGAVQDTYNLIRKGIIKVLDEFEGRIDVPGLGLALDYRNKSKPKIDWDNADEREKMLNILYQDSLKVISVVSKLELTEGEKKLLELLVTVTNQDIEKKEDGTVKIKKGVAKDRIISITDPEMRHGRKSSSNLFDGYKYHQTTEEEEGFITNLDVTAGNVHDSEPCPKLIDEQPEDRRPDTLKGDTAFGTGNNRAEMKKREVKLISPVPDTPGYKGCFPKSMFKIDLDNQTCRCPVGELAPNKIFNKKTGELEVFKFSEEQCHTCPFQDQCTKNKKGTRTVTVNKHERLLQEGRAFQETEEFQKEYPGRCKIEAKNAELVHHGLRQARYIGLGKVRLQAFFIGTLVNFKLYWKLHLKKQSVVENITKTPIPNAV
jgi:transposase